VHFEKISLTARLAAYMRQYSDIPFAKDVARQLHAQEAFDQLLHDHQMKPDDLLWYAPIFEARYKSIAELIRKSAATQVLELASGLSLRGLAMTQAGNLDYVESDLEELTMEKTALISDLCSQYNLELRGNLHLVSANALDYGQIRNAIQHFHRDQPVTVINEGLFQYLTASEMRTVAQNVRDLLTEFGGIWITPDFSLRDEVKNVSELQRRFRQVVTAATDRQMYNNAFENRAQLEAFIAGLGLQSQALNQLDVSPDIVSIDVLKLAPQTLDRAKSQLKLWVLTLDHH
jgi:O-methyltransferase involved in polyketide biosynthesis